MSDLFNTASRIVQDAVDSPLEEGGQVLPMQYGGGLDDAYMNRSNAFAAPDANSAFDRPIDSMPMSSPGSLDDTYMSLSQRRNALPMMSREQGGGLKSIPRERMISDQPHQLSYINEEEAGLLKALGGSGRKVDSIPAYFYGDGDWSGMDDGPSADGPSADGPSYSDDISYDVSAPGNVGGPEGGNTDGTWTDDQVNMFNVAPSKSIGDMLSDGDITWDEYTSIAGEMARGLGTDQDDINSNYISPASGRTFSASDYKGIQSLADRGYLAGLGIKGANALENIGMRSFGKDMRGPFEAHSPGKALSRANYDPNTLTGLSSVLGGNINSFRTYLFDLLLDPTETVRDVADRYEYETGQKAPTESFGFSRNSDALVTDVTESLNASALHGVGQGFSLMGSIAMSPIAGIMGLSSRYDDEADMKDMKTTDALSDLRSMLSENLGLNKFGDMLSGLKDSIFGKSATAFEAAQDKAYESRGITSQERAEAEQMAKDMGIPLSEFAGMPINGKEQPTLEDVNTVMNETRTNPDMTLMDIYNAIDNPFQTAIDTNFFGTKGESVADFQPTAAEWETDMQNRYGTSKSPSTLTQADIDAASLDARSAAGEPAQFSSEPTKDTGFLNSIFGKDSFLGQLETKNTRGPSMVMTSQDLSETPNRYLRNVNAPTPTATNSNVFQSGGMTDLLARIRRLEDTDTDTESNMSPRQRSNRYAKQLLENIYGTNNIRLG